MHKKYVRIVLFLLLPFSTLAQTYWQQEVNYTIRVQLDDQQHTLTAAEEIEYINHSPDQLTYIYVHLWPNAYQNTNTALAKQLVRLKKTDFQFASPSKRGYITNLNFKVNGQPADVETDPENPDIAKIHLDTPLRPGERLHITTPFTVKLPDSFSRLGHAGQSYQITQWFPKLAVYDPQGWHPLPYLDQGEFYSDYGKYDVSITLPANYTVGATGRLQNPEEQTRLDQLAAQTAAITKFPTDLSFPASATQTKTLHYVQENIHDFAWFADKRFNVLKSSVTLPTSGRPITTWLLFLNKDAATWVKSLRDLNDAVISYSAWVGDYPYDHVTAVDGTLSAGSGMEYPMVTVTDPEALIHEVGHNWFYGILGSNERENAWMDEGINSYYEFRLAERTNPDYSQWQPLVKSTKLRHLFGLENIHANALNILLYQLTASRGLDQPLQLPAADFTSTNYGGIVYMKTGILFKYLAAYLGQATFDRAMHTYYQQWQFRHPRPSDLQAIFEQESGKKLDWFFQGLVQTTRRVDAAITEAQVTAQGILVQVKNNPAMAVPIPVAAVDAAGKIIEMHWSEPAANPEALTFTRSNGAEKIVVDPGNILPEINRRNNEYRLKGIFPTREPLRLQFLGGIEQSDRRQLYYLPVVGANTYDKFMLGAALYNSSLIQKTFSYLAMPMYSFHQKRVNGLGQANLNLLSNKFSKSVVLGFKLARFERYFKYEPSLNFNLKRASGYAPEQQVRLALTHINQRERINISGQGDAYFEYTQAYTIPSLQYTLTQKNAVQRFALQASADLFAMNRNFDGLSNRPVLGQLSVEYDRHYRANKQVHVRWYTGKFFGEAGNPYSVFNLGLSGSQDYKKETTFLDRSQRSHSLTAFVHQTDNRDGAFKNYLPVYTGRWLSAINLAADVPVLPLSLYTDLGLASVIGETATVSNKFYYGSGLSIGGGRLLRFYFPVAGSNFEHHLPASFRDFTHNIRFVLNLNAYDPFKQLTEALK